jgi:hypothetical protein
MRTIWLLLLLCAVLAGGLLWVAGELHYRGCVRATGVAFQGRNQDLDRLVRNEQLSNCSKSPF